MSEEKIKKKQFEIKRIYIKDASFEAPNTPNIFDITWKPVVKFNFNIISREMHKNIFEVIIQVKIIVKIKEDLVFLCDVDQAGIFSIVNFSKTELKYCLYSNCPNILFPYVRECIANLVAHASFPQMNLAPINFDAIYLDHVKIRKE